MLLLSASQALTDCDENSLVSILKIYLFLGAGADSAVFCDTGILHVTVHKFKFRTQWMTVLSLLHTLNVICFVKAQVHRITVQVAKLLPSN